MTQVRRPFASVSATAEEVRAPRPGDGLVPDADVAMDRGSIEAVIAAGQPIAISMPVYESFEDVGQDGVLSIPNPSTEALLGGHGILILAYDEKGMTGANQWGTTWGDKGFFHMPWGYETIWWEAKTATPSA